MVVVPQVGEHLARWRGARARLLLLHREDADALLLSRGEADGDAHLDRQPLDDDRREHLGRGRRVREHLNGQLAPIQIDYEVDDAAAAHDAARRRLRAGYFVPLPLRAGRVPLLLLLLLLPLLLRLLRLLRLPLLEQLPPQLHGLVERQRQRQDRRGALVVDLARH
eukprot:3723529-Prymnesium_polylepis.2